MRNGGQVGRKWWLKNKKMKKKTIVLQDCRKTFTLDQDKALTPEETVENFYKKVDQFEIKIVNEVRRIDNGRLDIPVYFSVCGDDAFHLTGTRKQMGKGASPEQARASACMELAERFSFFSFKNNPDNFLVGDYRSMAGDGYPVLEIRYLLDSVHDSRTDVSTLEKLLENIPMQWVWATNLTDNCDVLIPFSWFYAINEFNGPSAGNTLEEAALQGICEIVERHVCSIVNYRRIETPKIDANSVNDPVAVELLQKFADQSIELYLNDFTLDTGICTVAALAVDWKTFPAKSEIVYTAGTATDPQKALIRAVTEVAQLAGDFNTGSNYVASGLPKPNSMEEVDYLTGTEKIISIQEMSDLSDPNIRIEVENCIRSLKRIGMEVFMIDVTHDKLQIPACYTIIPGAHFRERSRISDAGLFAAKLMMDLVDDTDLREKKLSQMEELLREAYYLAFYRGKNLVDMGQLDKALVYFEKALSLDPEEEDLPYILSYMGSCLKELDRYEEAVHVLEKGLEEDEQRPDIHNSLGVCFFKLEMYEKAIKHFQRAVELNPASAIDYANLGVNYHRLGKNDSAVEFLTLALTLDDGLDFAKELLEKIASDRDRQ